MKLSGLLIAVFMLIAGNAAVAQQQSITVKAGTRVIDYFPPEIRFRYDGFQTGRVIFMDGTYTAAKLNYNYLYGDMQFIQGRDTLSIANADKIDFVAIQKDTFFYNNGYLELLSDVGPLRLVRKQYVRIVDVQKQEAYGMTSSNSATRSFSSMPYGGRYYSLVVQQDVLMRMQKEYYLGSKDGFEVLRKKVVLEMFPTREGEIKRYLKDHPVDFDAEEEVIAFCSFLDEIVTPAK